MIFVGAPDQAKLRTDAKVRVRRKIVDRLEITAELVRSHNAQTAKLDDKPLPETSRYISRFALADRET